MYTSPVPSALPITKVPEWLSRGLHKQLAMVTTLYTVAKRTRVRTAHLLLQRLTVSKAPKFHASHRPILHLREVENKIITRKNEDRSNISALMVTYTVFDPGASRPLLLSSALLASRTLPACGSSIESKYLQTSKSSMSLTYNSSTKPQDKMSSALSMSLALPKHNGSIASTQQLHHEAGGAVMVRPWPYSLPTVLQPQPGTAYDSIYGDQGGAKPIGKVRAVWLQRVLYGDPDP